MKRVLLVEDNPQVRSLISLILRSEGFHVDECHHGEQALQRLQAAIPYQVILLDMMVPLVDGMQLLGYVQSDPVHASTPVLVLSSRSEDADILAAYNAGASHYMIKPFEPDDLLMHLNRLAGLQVKPTIGLSV